MHWTFAERKACGPRAGEGCDRESLELNSLSNANSRSSVSAGSSGRRPAANRFVCPGCGGGRAAALKCRAYTYECLDCSRQTSISAGTAMHRSKLALRTWFWAAHLMATHSNGMSARQLEDQLGVTYKTAWLLAQKLRGR